MFGIEALKHVDPQGLYGRFIKEGLRPDGRGLKTARKVTITQEDKQQQNFQPRFHVRLGQTAVLCGISCQIAVPNQNIKGKSEGFLIPVLHVGGICSPLARGGIPTDHTLAITSSLTRILQCANLFSLSDLCIVQDRAVWALYIDVVCLNDDGNLLDASLIAILAALKNCKFLFISFPYFFSIFKFQIK